MVNHESPHPSPEQLLSFATGRLSEDELSQVAQHLETCPACLASIDTPTIDIAPTDKFVDLVRSVDDAATRTSPARLPVGYEILEPIGQGGMGIVYKARQIGLGRIVAFKRMRHGGLGRAEDFARFRAEAEVMARLTHPNIVQVFEVGEQDGSPFLACEFVPGKGLDSFLRGVPLPARSAAQLVATLARAAHVAHQHSIVHRDLKPSNVLITWTDTTIPPDAGDAFWDRVTPKIADFGLAKRLDIPDGRTHTDAVLGTPDYMAPEQAGGQSRAVGPATDIHALGAILYEALTGRRPFQGTDIGETLKLVRESDPKPLRSIRPKLARDLEVICLKCLEKDPARRYVSAEALADDIEAWLDGRTIVAKPPSVWERSSKWVRRNSGWAIAAVLGATLVLGSIIGVAVHVSRLRLEAIRASAAETQSLESTRRGYEAINGLIQEWSRDPPATLAWQARDVQLKDQALVFLYDALKATDGDDPRVQLSRGMLLAYAGGVQGTLKRFDLARRDLTRAAEILQPLCNDPLLGAEARNYQSNCQYQLGLTLIQLKEPIEAESLLNASLALLPEAGGKADDVASLGRLAMRHEGIGNAQVGRNQLDRARESFKTFFELRRQMLKLDPGDVNNHLRFAEACRIHAAYNGRQLGLDNTERVLDEGEAALRTGSENPSSPAIAKNLAILSGVRAALEVERGNIDRALACHDRGIESAQSALNREPNDIEAKGWLHVLHRGKAYTLCRIGRAGESFPHWEQAILYVDGDAKAFCRMERALERAIIGEHRQATEEAAEIIAQPEVRADVWQHAARVYSRAMEAADRDTTLGKAEQSRLIADYARRGMECLDQSTKQITRSTSPLSIFSLSEIDADPAFATLKATDGFRKWRASQK